MKSILLSFCLSISTIILLGQVTEDFSDGELLNNPTWQGDLDMFAISEEGKLQLMALEAGEAKIFTELRSSDLFIWQLDVNMDFASLSQ